MGGSIVADSIAKAYGNRRILTAARLEARRGAITFLAGRNGSGKSTLLRIIAGVLAPDFGVVRYAGRSLERPALYKLAQLGLFYLPDREILSPARPLGQQLAVVTQRFRRPAPTPAAESLGIAHLLAAKPATFSTGELRKAEICLAVVRNPVYLVVDEPLRSIDPIDADVVVHHLRALADAGCTVLVSGHDANSLMQAADSVVWVTSGTCYAFDSPAEAARNENFRREYLTGTW